MTALPTRILGDRSVSAVGLGAMPLSIDGKPDEAQAFATIHAALDAGVTLIDTADAYCLDQSDFGANEDLIRRALDAYEGDAAEVLVATKGGHTREGAGWGLNGRADYLIAAAEASRDRLGVESIALYQHHRPDPDVHYLDSIGALRHLLDDGVIQLAGISNADVDQIQAANEILGGRLASVQNEFSPGFRSSQAEIDLCAELGIAFLPWSPLGGVGRSDVGASHERFQQVADAHGVSAQQVALAWELANQPVVIPIPGARRRASIEDSVKAASLRLSDEDLAGLNAS